MSHYPINQQAYQNITNGNNYKPKVAFVYENCNQNMKEVYHVNESNQNNQKKGCIYQGGEINGGNVCSTPKKIENKENSFLHVPSKGDINHNVRYQNINLGNTQNNTQFVEKKPNSPMGCKLPPHSPKHSSKKLQQKCPSFLNPKEKENVQIENENIFATVCKCGKNISHQVVKTLEKCCSTCGVAKMIQGFELEACSPVNLRKSEIYLGEPSSSILNKVEGSKSFPEFLRELKEERILLEKSYKEVSLSSSSVIRSFYKEKKLELKSHYEKIKLAIKESIEEDLKEIENIEREKICEWESSLLSLESDMKKLEKIETELSELSKSQSESKVSKELYEEYEGIVARNKTDGSNRNSKVDADVDTMAISGVSNVASNASFMSCTLLKNLGNGSDMYKSSIYRMISSKVKSPRVSEPCYESKIEILKKERESEKIESGQINERCLLNEGGNLLFSFQGKV